MFKVFRCGADHCRAADIYIFHRFFQAGAGLGGDFSEGIEVDYEKLDRYYILRGELLPVLLQVEPGQQATVDLWMQGFYPPPRISGKPVTPAASVTGMPAPSRTRAVPPVEMISHPMESNWRARFKIPLLSETLISARLR